MNSNNYLNATVAYNSGDYIKAMEGFYNCLTEDSATFEPGDAGLVYHRLGNCLVKVERYEEATSVYRRSLEDEFYLERGSLHVNLGTALSALGRYDEAMDEFQAALDDETYNTPFRAWMGMGNALSKLGRIVEAGTAYRNAALDPSNTNPVKALMNLGASFSALDRPRDAVEAYLAILDFRVTGLTLNRTYERLGSAYFADGQYAEAIQAFNDAQLGGNYQISERSLYQLSQARMALASPDALPEQHEDDAYPKPSLEDSSSLPSLDAEISGPFTYGAELPSEADINFFTASDADLIAASKRMAKRESRLRHTGLRILFGFLVTIVIVSAAGIFAFTQGYGLPTQQSVVRGFFDSYAANRPVEQYWIEAAQTNSDKYEQILLAVVKADSSAVTIRHIERSVSESEVLIDVQTPEGGTVHYSIRMVRDGLGWKIQDIKLVFASHQR